MAAFVVLVLVGGSAWLLVGDSSSDLAAAPGTVEVTIKDIERPRHRGALQLVDGWVAVGGSPSLREIPTSIFTKGLGGFAVYAANVDGDPVLHDPTGTPTSRDGRPVPLCHRSTSFTWSRVTTP